VLGWVHFRVASCLSVSHTVISVSTVGLEILMPDFNETDRYKCPLMPVIEKIKEMY